MTTKNFSVEQMSMTGQLGTYFRRIIVSGPIRDETAALFLDQITTMEYADVGAPINIYINSPGGHVDSALAMLDSMACCSCPIQTIGVGTVASAAVLLMAAGDKGNRVLTPNCRVMIHQVSGGLSGTSAEIENEVQEIFRLQEMYNKILSKYTGKSVQQLKQDMTQNYYMSAQEAISYGIADKVMPPRKISRVEIPSLKQKVFRKKKSV